MSCTLGGAYWIYVTDRDGAGAAFLLHPLPENGHTNPVGPGPCTLPGPQRPWIVTSAGGTEEVVAVLSRSRREDIEDRISTLPHAKPVDLKPTARLATDDTLLVRSTSGFGRVVRIDSEVLRIRLQNPR
jgi:hypothetical protein